MNRATRRALENPLNPFANAKPALSWLKILRAASPLAKRTAGSPRQGQTPPTAARVQNSRSPSIRDFGGLPRDNGTVDRPNRHAGDSVGLDAGLRRRFVDSGLIGAERAAAL